MRATLRLAALTLCLVTFSATFAGAQQSGPPPERKKTFGPDEIVSEGHRFFGTVSRGLAQVVQAAFSKFGEPNGYILGQEGSGAFVVGLRYGDGKLYTRNAGDRRDLSALRRRRWLGVFYWRLRHDGVDRQQYRRGADPLRRRPAPRRQYRLFEIHAETDMEPVLVVVSAH